MRLDEHDLSLLRKDFDKPLLTELIVGSAQVAYQGSSYPWSTESHMGPSLRCGCSTLERSLRMAWKGSWGWCKSFGSCTYLVDLEEATGSWLRLWLSEEYTSI